MAELTGGGVHLFHSCYQPPVSGIYPVKADVNVYKEKTASLLTAFGIAESHLHIEEDEVQKSLPATLKKLGASVLIMGAVSRSAVDRFFVGNTAEKLLDRVDQDVLILKPEGFTDRVKKARISNL